MVMRNPIHKRIPRLLIKEPTRYLPLFVLLLVTIVCLSSFYIVQGAVESIYYDHLETGCVEDGQFTTITELSEATWEKIEKKGVRLYKNFYVETEDGEATLNLYAMRKSVNLPTTIVGRLPETADEIALDENYTNAHGYHVGESITVGKQHFQLVGTVVLPDYIAMMKNRNDLVMDTMNFGVGLVSDSGFQRFSDKGVQYNYAYLEEKKSADKKEANDKLKELTKLVYEDNILTDAMTRAQNKRISYLIDDMGGDVPMMHTILFLAMVSMAFVFTMQARNLIESESGAIGTLMASGYSKWELLRHYMLLPLLSVLSASLVGNILAYTKLYKMYEGMYYSSFSLPPFTPFFHLRAFLLTTLIPAVVILLINLFLLLRMLSISPLRFLRKDWGKKMRTMAIDLPKMPFLTRYRLKVLRNNKGNVFVLLFGVTLASIFLCFGLGMRPIFEAHTKSIMEELPANVQTYVREADDAVDGEKFGAASFELVIDGKTHSFELQGISEHSRYFPEHLLTGLKENEIAASEGLLEKFQLHVGDGIEVINPYTAERYEFTIRTVRSGAVSLSAYMPLQAFNTVMGYAPDYFSGYYSDQKLNLDEKNVVARIDREAIGQVAKHFLDNFDAISGPIVFISILFYFVFIYLLAKAIVEKSKTDISYLKIFGFTDRESTRIYLHATGIILGFYLLLLPILLQKLMVILLRVALQKFDAYMAPVLPSYVYLIAMGTGFILFSFVQYLQMRKIGKINMAEVLKEVCG